VPTGEAANKAAGPGGQGQVPGIGGRPVAGAWKLAFRMLRNG